MSFNDIKVITSAIAIINFAESLPLETITVSNSEPAYPVTIGENLVAYTLGLLLPHDWSSDETEQLVEEIESCLSRLDMGVSDEADWRALFEAKNRLSGHMNELDD